ncbi:MAG: GAF domain-containing protein [Nitrosomonadales bacterium]|nr:GAF domain-containing protein [Nitrosomonadales bacterium]
MSDTLKNLQQELQAAQRALAETKARCERHDAEHQAAAKELEDNRNALLFMLEDLENARQKVEQAHQEWMAALDVVDDPIFLHDKHFRILRANRAYQQCAGVPFKEVIGQLYYEVFPKSHRPLPCCLRAMEKAEEEEEEEEEVTVGNAIYRSRSFSVHDEQGAHLYSVHILEDITESRRAEQEQRRNAAVNAALAGLSQYFLSAPQLAIEDVSARVLGVARQLTGSEFGYVGYIDADTGFLIAPTLTRDIWDQCEVAGKSVVFEKWDGLWGWVLTHKKSLISNAPSTDPRSGGIPKGHVPIKRFLSAPALAGEQLMGQVSLANADHDYTDRDMAVVERLADFYAIVVQRVRSEKALRDSEARFRQAMESTRDAFIVLEGERGTITLWNHAAEAIFGYSKDEAVGQALHEFLVPSRFREAVRAGMAHFSNTGEGAAVGKTLELFALRKNGEEFPIEFSLSATQLGGKWYATGIARDITERKRAEAAIQHANRALATLSAVNSTLVRAASEEELLQAVCQAIVQQRGYQLAWVGYVQHDENKTIRIMAYASDDGGYPDTMQPTWAEEKQGMWPSGRAVRSGVTQMCQDIASDPHYQPWRDEALKRGYAASIALSLLNGDNTVFGILTVYADEANAFNPSEISLLEEMAGDLAFGVRTLHTRRERDLALEQSRQHLERLQNSLEDTVRAIASIVEMRDPYTAGHQVRVADLAAAIARQMGLPDEQMHAIHLAGVVHDLGKIKIPAEILSRPGKITDIEYSLIKVHPQAGYDILKGINFPWPIAQMVLQHHERRNGSGYPQGIKGDAILLEARILSVADVVEAMSSHRPYRPGLGIEAAMEEITKNCGKFYDPQVVDACLALFREQHYSFK